MERAIIYKKLIADSQFVIINLPQNIGGAGGDFQRE